jgi:hypothetical protein
MERNDFWTTVRNKGGADAAGGSLKAALVFGAVVIAVAMVVAPLLGSRESRMIAQDGTVGIDTLTTGSIPAGAVRTYTLRRSITQPMPDALCIIDSAGNRRGAC